MYLDESNLNCLTEPVLKAKWKGLRDTFRAELKKEQVFQQSKYQRNRPVWIHFKSLLFLKDQMLPRPPIWERPARNDNERNSESEGESSLPQNSRQSSLDDNDPGASDLPLSPEADGNNFAKADTTSGNHHHRRANSHRINDQIDVKEEPVESYDNVEFHNVSDNQLNDNEMMLQNISPEQVLMGDTDSNAGINIDPLDGGRCDDNYYFLMSLLPHIRTLPADRRMLLRMQMQELVYKEVYKKGTNDVATMP